jgi:putative SOS response-associated peptidase YedK
MCGRFVAATEPDGLARLFVVDDRVAEDVAPSWNVAPTDRVHAVVEHVKRRLLVAFRWGLIPPGATDRRTPLINARVETAASKPAFRDAFARRRCIVPADGFYEWTTAPDGRKIPHFIHAPDDQPLAFAGLWSVWRDPASADQPPLRTCTILTTAASGDVARLHDRMPVILPPARWDAWLDRELSDVHEVAHAAAVPPAPLTYRRASSEVNSPRNNHEGLLHAE